MPYDPMAWYQDYLARLGQPAQRQQPALTPLSPEEEDSLLGQVTGQVLGGLGYAGATLEKTFGGRAVRGLLGGKPRELLSPIPFSDTLGITDPKDRTSGRELLAKAGLLSPNDQTWGGFAAGLGAELLTDPAMYLTLGGAAIGPAGEIASKVGLLPPTLIGRTSTTLGQALAGASPAVQQAAARAAQAAGHGLPALANEALGGVAGLGLPFARPSVLLGAGPGGTQFLQGLSGAGQALTKVPVVGPALGKIGEGADYLGRLAAANFDPQVLGAITREGQATAREATTLARQLSEQARGRIADYALELGGAGRRGAPEFRDVVEGVLTGPAHPVDAGVAAGLRGNLDAELQAMQDLGIDISALKDDFVDYAPRQQSTLAVDTPGYGAGPPRRALPTHDVRIDDRALLLKNIPGGTGAINRLVADPSLASLNPLQASDAIRRGYLGWSAADDAQRAALNAIPAATRTPQQAADLAALNARYSQGLDLANWRTGLDPQFLSGQTPFFGNHPLTDSLGYFERTARLRGAADASHNLLARTAVPAAQAPPGSVPVMQVLKDAGLDYNVIVPGGPGRGGLNTLAAKLGVQPADLANLAVPKEIAGDVGRYLRGFTVPESVGPVLKGFDYLTNITKAYQTATWPGFHVRNWLSGLWQNFVVGGFDPRFADPVSGFLRPLADMKALTEGGIIEGASTIPGLAGLDDAAATAQLAKEMFAYRAAGRGLVTNARDLVGNPGSGLPGSLGGLLHRIPGQTPETFAGAIGEAGKGWATGWNPLKIHGAGANTDLFPLMAAGRRAGDIVEDLNRGSLFIALRRQGYLPEQAAQTVRAAHFDYQALTPVERTVMRRLIPFYTWSRQNIPFTLEQLLTKPGGTVATGVRVGAALREGEEGGFVPPYLGGGLAVPLGEEEEGTRRYLTRIDLPFEQALELPQFGPKGLEQTGMRLLGQMNPLLKAPLEMITGRQFYTGRDLEDLYSPTGSTLLEQGLMNSPLARAYTTAKTLADERKGVGTKALNLLTGVKVSDVDVEKQRNIAAREIINDTLRGQQGVHRYETLYVPQQEMGQLSPEQVALLRLQRTLEQQAKQPRKIGVKR